MPVLLSPLEKAVLHACIGGRRVEQLQAELLTEFEPESVASALAFLRRRRCVESTNGRWAPTVLGSRVLERELARERQELHASRPGRRHLHVA